MSVENMEKYMDNNKFIYNEVLQDNKNEYLNNNSNDNASI